jgi:phosphoribosylamine---glycine ligase
VRNGPRVCVVGNGGREHALARWLSRAADVVVTPGRAGMVGRPEGDHPVAVTSRPPEDIEADLVVVGPEEPLVRGLADRLRADGRLVVGPGADGARLEGSKAWMKEVLANAGIPTARFGAFDDEQEALAFLDELPGPWVVKTDGLAAGKGVLVAATRREAEHDIRTKLSGTSFGSAGRKVVVEECLSGIECSLQVLCDGRQVLPLELAQDFKRLGDGDAGPNTGGMGAYSPLDWAPPGIVDRIVEDAVEPLVHAFRRRGIDYRGVLYAGLMLTDEGPKVLEYNVRFADPEAQVVLPRLRADPAELLMAVADGRLTGSLVDQARFEAAASVCVVLAADGYPGEVRRGDVIQGLGPDGQLADPLDSVTVLHAGTELVDGRFVTAGGRVVDVVAQGSDVATARSHAYRAADQVAWAGARYRRDIAAPAAGAVGVGS